MREGWAEFFGGGRGSMGPSGVRDQVEQFLNEAHELKAQLSELTGVGYGRRRLVGVRVDSVGRVTKTVVSDEHGQFPAEVMAEEFSAAFDAAVSDLEKKIQEIAGPLLQARESLADVSRW